MSQQDDKLRAITHVRCGPDTANWKCNACGAVWRDGNRVVCRCRRRYVQGRGWVDLDGPKERRQSQRREADRRD